MRVDISVAVIIFVGIYYLMAVSIDAQCGQLENSEMREWKPEQEGAPKTEIKILDWAAHHNVIVP